VRAGSFTHTVRVDKYRATIRRLAVSRSTWAHLLDITPAQMRSKALERVELGKGCSSFQSVPRMRRALERRVLEGSRCWVSCWELVLVEVFDRVHLHMLVE
jgi:hypothetical protein